MPDSLDIAQTFWHYYIIFSAVVVLPLHMYSVDYMVYMKIQIFKNEILYKAAQNAHIH